MTRRVYPSTLQRLLSKYHIPADPNACWSWLASTNQNGYGHISVSGRLVQSHRLSFELFVGPIEDGLHILHSCDNPPCGNPKHLYQGTEFQNGFDKAIRWRARRSARGLPFGVTISGDKFRAGAWTRSTDKAERRFVTLGYFSSAEEAGRVATGFKMDHLQNG